MSKAFTPGTYIIGPKGYTEKLQIVQEPVVKPDGGVTMKKIKKPVRFPVFRGMSSKLANHIRSQHRRQVRKAEDLLIQEIVNA